MKFGEIPLHNTNPEISAVARAKQEILAKQSLVEAELRYRNDQIEQMMIEDPVKFEALVKSGELLMENEPFSDED